MTADDQMPVYEADDYIRDTIRQQVGAMNILSVSGGRWTPIPDGVEFPVSSGMVVRVHYGWDDLYEVERVFTRAGREFPHGKRTGVDMTEVSEAVYYAGMYKSYDAETWVTKSR